MDTHSNARRPRRIIAMSTLNDSFEAIAIDDDDGDDNNNNNTATTNSGPVGSDDENVATPAPPTQTPNTAAETNVDSDVIPLVFLRGGSVPLCVLHQRVATSAKLCSRFAEIRCVDATCQAASYMAKSEVNEIGAKLPPLIRCRFHGNGCPVEQLLHLRAQHEVRCAYRPIVGDDDDDDDDAALLNEFAVVGRAKPVLVAPEKERMFPVPEAEPEKDLWGRLNDSDMSIELTRASKELGDKAGESLLRARNAIAEVTAPVFAQIGEATAPVFDKVATATAPMRTKISNNAAPLVENAAMAAGVVTDKVVNVMVPAIVTGTEKVVNNVAPVLNRGLRDIRDELESSLFADHQRAESGAAAAAAPETAVAAAAAAADDDAK